LRLAAEVRAAFNCRWCNFPATSGNNDAIGKGGDRVWRDALDPAEQRTLKRLFE